MLKLIRLLYFFSLINLLICNTIEERHDVTSMSKYMVYTGMEMENVGNYMLSVGAIIRNDLIITNIAINNDEFRAIAESVLQIDVNVYGFVVAGVINFTSTPQKMNMYYASDVRSIQRFAYNDNFLINRTEFFEPYRVFPQISIIKLTHHLPLNGITMDALNFPLRYDTEGDNCLVAGWGNIKNISGEAGDTKVFETKVTVLSEKKCISIIPEYKTNLCIVPKEEVNQCDIFNGGEPLICSGLLIGVVSEMSPCESAKPRPCTGINESHKWIEFQLYDRLKYRKSCQTRYKPFTKLFSFTLHAYLWKILVHIVTNAVL